MQKVVIDKITKLVKRYGYTDFASKPDFDPNTEQVIENDFVFDQDYEYTWDGETFIKGDEKMLELSPQAVKIHDVADLDPNIAKTKVKGINFDVPAQSWGQKDFSFPYKVNILSGDGFTGFAGDGDIFEFLVSPDTPVGQVTQAKASGQTVIPVSQTVIENILAGFWCKFALNPALPGQAIEHEIVHIDIDSLQITISPALNEDVTTNHYVLMSIKYAEDLELQHGENIDIGGRAAGSSSVPANTIMRARYYNAGSQAKRIRLRLTLKYGGNSN